MYNGYLEACCQEPGKGTGEMLKDFLEKCQSSDYDGNSRYSSYADADMREKFGWDHPAMEGVSEEELNWQITKELISDYQQTRVEQGVQTEDYTERFISQLKADIARGE